MGCSRCGKGRRAAKRAIPGRADAKAEEHRTGAADRGNGVRPPAGSRARAQTNPRAVPYTIVRGDTMADIGRRFGMTTQEITKYDGGTGVPNLARIRSRNVHVLSPGEVILVPRKGN